MSIIHNYLSIFHKLNSLCLDDIDASMIECTIHQRLMKQIPKISESNRYRHLLWNSDVPLI